MSESDNYLKLLDKVGEISTSVGVLKSELRHLCETAQETKDKVSQIEIQDIEQNRLLDQHILGVKTNMERLDVEIDVRKIQMKEFDIRLKKAEFVPNLASNLKTALLWVAAIFGALKTLHII